MNADYTYDVFYNPTQINHKMDQRLMKELSEHLSSLLNSQAVNLGKMEDAGTCSLLNEPRW